jgi:hypothetical protein
VLDFQLAPVAGEETLALVSASTTTPTRKSPSRVASQVLESTLDTTQHEYLYPVSYLRYHESCHIYNLYHMIALACPAWNHPSWLSASYCAWCHVVMVVSICAGYTSKVWLRNLVADFNGHCLFDKNISLGTHNSNL